MGNFQTWKDETPSTLIGFRQHKKNIEKNIVQ
jgi:hypothetical protein